MSERRRESAYEKEAKRAILLVAGAGVIIGTDFAMKKLDRWLTEKDLLKGRKSYKIHQNRKEAHLKRNTSSSSEHTEQTIELFPSDADSLIPTSRHPQDLSNIDFTQVEGMGRTLASAGAVRGNITEADPVMERVIGLAKKWKISEEEARNIVNQTRQQVAGPEAPTSNQLSEPLQIVYGSFEDLIKEAAMVDEPDADLISHAEQTLAARREANSLTNRVIQSLKDRLTRSNNTQKQSRGSERVTTRFQNGLAHALVIALGIGGGLTVVSLADHVSAQVRPNSDERSVPSEPSSEQVTVIKPTKVIDIATQLVVEANPDVKTQVIENLATRAQQRGLSADLIITNYVNGYDSEDPNQYQAVQDALAQSDPKVMTQEIKVVTTLLNGLRGSVRDPQVIEAGEHFTRPNGEYITSLINRTKADTKLPQ